MFKVPEVYRFKTNQNHPFFSLKHEKNGVFFIPTNIMTTVKDVQLMCIASEANDLVEWEHVSVSVKKINKNNLYDLDRCPT